VLESTATALSSPQSLPLLMASVVTSVSHPPALQPAALTDAQQCPSLAITMPSVATSVSHPPVLQPATLTDAQQCPSPAIITPSVATSVSHLLALQPATSTDIQPHLSPAIVTAAAMLTTQAQEHPLASSPISAVQQRSKPLKAITAPEPQPGTTQPAVHQICQKKVHCTYPSALLFMISLVIMLLPCKMNPLYEDFFSLGLLVLTPTLLQAPIWWC